MLCHSMCCQNEQGGEEGLIKSPLTEEHNVKDKAKRPFFSELRSSERARLIGLNVMF